MCVGKCNIVFGDKWNEELPSIRAENRWVWYFVIRHKVLLLAYTSSTQQKLGWMHFTFMMLLVAYNLVKMSEISCWHDD